MSQAPNNLPFDPMDVVDPTPETPSAPASPVVSPPPAPSAPVPPPAPITPPPIVPPSAASTPRPPDIQVMPPVDMFADVAPKTATPPTPARVVPTLPATESSSTLKYAAIGFCGLVLCGGVGFAAWKLFLSQKTNTPAVAMPSQPAVVAQTPEPTPTPTPTPEPEQPTMPVATDPTPTPIADPVTTPPAGTNVPLPNTAPSAPATPAIDVTADSDQDRLTDVREIELGTDPQKADSDGDALGDGNEVLMYGTNPVNPDTDGDGYADGAEVEKGYDPRGPGKCKVASCIVP